MLKITTKVQNIVLGLILLIATVIVVGLHYTQLSANQEKVTNQEYNKLAEEITNVEETINRYFKTNLDNLGQIYYDDRIKKALFMRNTRLYPTYQEKAQNALQDFAIYKQYNNLILFDPSFNLIASVNRSFNFPQELLVKIINRLETQKQNQLVLQRLDGKSVIIYFVKLKYEETQYAYLVSVEELFPAIAGLPNMGNNMAEYYFTTKTLDYKDSLLNLSGENTPDNFYLKEDTLMKYSPHVSMAFNYMGQETISKVEVLSDFQYAHVLGLLKVSNFNGEVNQARDAIIKNFAIAGSILGLLGLLYVVLVVTKTNIQYKILQFIDELMYRLNPAKQELRARDKVKQVQKEAYAYAEQEASIKNTMFKAYSALKKMTPEDIRNLSIKNSLSKENIRLVYQPVVNSKTMQSEFCEVYLRLLNYYGEELMPSEFIPVLKHFNMLENLDEMMLDKVIKKIQSLQSTDSTAKISLNISSGAFNSDKFLRKLKSSFITGEIGTKNVMLELPALDVINDERSVEFIDELTNYGVHFAVSISSLENSTVKKILEHKIKFVKIDMSAFASVLENEAKQKVLKQILANSKKHDIKIIAERIETELMFKLAKSLDIEFLQGYYIGKPKKYYTHK
jgi:EAL domain-containing protein (putative c-di-GMP-specific phosphodiesterase class I)